MLLLTLLQQIRDLLRLTASPLTAATLIEPTDAPPSHILVLIRMHPIDHSALQVLGPFSLDKFLILHLLQSDLFVEFVVGLLEALPDSLDHLLILFAISHVEGVPYF